MKLAFILCTISAFAISTATVVPRTQASRISKSPVSADRPALKTSVREWVHGGPCSRSNYKCMNVVALKYVNKIRAQKNLSPYTLGTNAMLDNAMAHSFAQKRKGSLYHQDFRKVSLGCSSFLSGENVAMNHELMSRGTPTDPAKLCVNQLRDSPPHYKNLVSDYHAQAVMGVVVANDGYIWCTQTFTVNTKYGNGRCARSGGTNLSAAKDTDIPKAPRATKEDTKPHSSNNHIFRNKSLELRYRNRATVSLILRCSNSRCRYCHSSSSRCLSEKRSVKLDERYS
eukprot:IDg12369t1